MKLQLIELTKKNEIRKTYDMYRHCMFDPTEEKFDTKIDQFLSTPSIKILACLNGRNIEGIIVISFVEKYRMEIVGIAVNEWARGKGIGSFMIQQAIQDYNLRSAYAETDKDAVDFYRKNGFSITAFSEIFQGETVIRYKCEFSR